MNSPSEHPMRYPRPAADRLALRSATSSPSCHWRTTVWRRSKGGTSSSGLTILRCWLSIAKTCHTTKNRTTAPARQSASACSCAQRCTAEAERRACGCGTGATSIAGMRLIARHPPAFGTIVQKRADLPSSLDELRTRVVARAREIDVDGRTNSTRPWRHHDDAVRHQDGFLDAVRDHQYRLLGCLADPHELTLDALPALLVEGAEWLVEQHDLWIGRECAAHCNALAHAARELLGKGVLESGEPDKVDQLRQPCDRARAWARGRPSARTRYCRARSSTGTTRAPGTRFLGRAPAPRPRSLQQAPDPASGV